MITHFSIFKCSLTGMKYMIKPLEALCVDFLLKIIDIANMLAIFQFFVDCTADERLMAKCMEILRTRTWSVLHSKCFRKSKISHKCLMALLEDDLLSGSEIRLFESVCFLLFPFSFFFILYPFFLCHVICLSCF